MRKRQLSSIELQSGEVQITVWKLYEGPLAQFVNNILKNEGLEHYEDHVNKIYRHDTEYIIIRDDTILLVETSKEISFEELLRVIKNIKLGDVVPEVSGLRIPSSSSLFKLFEEALDKYSQLKLRALEKIPLAVTVFFCSLSNFPWIVKIENLETFENELCFYRHFIEALLNILKIAGIEVQNYCSILDHVHVLCPEFGTFVATVLEHFDACFEASVQHHGKDRAHKYSILIPSETVWRLGISPGTRLDVRIRIVK